MIDHGALATLVIGLRSVNAELELDWDRTEPEPEPAPRQHRLRLALARTLHAIADHLEPGSLEARTA